jgi:type IV pilus assembly protein PilC
MPVFAYKAMDAKGKEVKNIIEADNTAQAINKLRDKGLFPTNVVEHKGKKTGKVAPVPGSKPGMSMTITIPFLAGKVKPKQLTLFTRQLATLIDAGLPLVRSLTVLRDQSKPGPLKNTLNGLAQDVESGSTFSEALAKYPKVFTKLYINMVKAGEVGGVMDVVLARLAEFSEKSEKLASKIKAALVYPSCVMFFATGVLVFLITFIVPKFMTIFKEVDAALPPMTQMLLFASNFMKNYWYIGIGGIVGFVVVFKTMSKIPFCKFYLDFAKLQMPVFGQLLRKVGVARFARTLGTLLASGVPILQALLIVRDTSGNEIIAKAVGNVHDSIREGESIAKPLERSKAFPLFVVNMIDVGEETGSLDQMLNKIADAYDDDVDTTVGALTSLLEPLMIVGMGLIVGFIVISMFLPLISLMGKLGG